MKKTLMRALLTACLSAAALVVQAASPEVLSSEHGTFRVTWESGLSPIEINRIHNWTLHIEDAAGNPVDGAVLQIKGGMPAHNHGLATAPGVEAMGNGDYLLGGLRFHMMGQWLLTLTITHAGVSDEVLITLDL